MPSAAKGTLIECDPAIRALVFNIDSKKHDIIIEVCYENIYIYKTNK